MVTVAKIRPLSNFGSANPHLTEVFTYAISKISKNNDSGRNCVAEFKNKISFWLTPEVFAGLLDFSKRNVKNAEIRLVTVNFR